VGRGHGLLGAIFCRDILRLSLSLRLLSEEYGSKIDSDVPISAPTLLARLVGLGLAQVGLILMFVTMVQNEFAQPVVSIQEDRGHVLVDTGLYGRVRHPLYTSFLIWFCGAALWLGSVMMASFGTGILMLALWPRILIEESTLKRDLDGYADYMRRVKHRIIPGLL
jgi:protein-S-isoprenylcysteine O-methyltransferase Ste14